MNFDFPLILVALTAITGLISAIDILFLAPKRRSNAVPAAIDKTRSDVTGSVPHEPKVPLVAEYSRSLFPVIFVVLVLRSFIVEPFKIPSESMMPTLLAGDFILVNKFIYGLRLPVLNSKILEVSEPERGDVVVFRYPENPAIDYIKRVVGLPGDHVVYRDKQLYINDVQVPREDLEMDKIEPNGLETRVYKETLGAIQHNIQIMNISHSGDYDKIVPAGHYFVMGDNRDNSRDSRFWGFMPEENLVGKAFFIWLNFGEWRRIGSVIK